MASAPSPPCRLITQLAVGAVLFLSLSAKADVMVSTQIITVGMNGRVFLPSNATAWAGDVIEFHFYPGNFSVVRSAYMFPCIPIENTGAGKQGFWSGFIDNRSPSPAKWRLTLTDSNPVFFYSSVADDCDRYGMVGGINVPEQEMRMQHDMALDSPYVVQPSAASHPTGDNVPSASASIGPQATQPAMSVGVIVGATLGGVLLLALIGAIFYLCGRRSRKRIAKQLLERGSTTRTTKSDAEGCHTSGGSSSAGKTSSAGSGHHPHQYQTRRETHASCSINLPPRGNDNVQVSCSGNHSHDCESHPYADRWQLEDGRSSIAISGSNHHNPPFGAAVSTSPIIDGDTIYVPVPRSSILSADHSGTSPSYYTASRLPCVNSPVNIAAQMLHQRWLAQEKIVSSDAESGVFGSGVTRFPSSRSMDQTSPAASPAPESPLPPLPNAAEPRLIQGARGVEQGVVTATSARYVHDPQDKPNVSDSQTSVLGDHANANAISGDGYVTGPGLGSGGGPQAPG